MSLFAKDPTPAEILVERVGFLRKAEAENRFDQTFAAINDFARKARDAKA